MNFRVPFRYQSPPVEDSLAPKYLSIAQSLSIDSSEEFRDSQSPFQETLRREKETLRREKETLRREKETLRREGRENKDPYFYTIDLNNGRRTYKGTVTILK